MKKVFFKPTGVYPAMATPFTASGNIDEAEMRRYVRWLIKQGVHGLFPLGSIGEFNTEEENFLKVKSEIYKIIKQLLGDRLAANI